MMKFYVLLLTVLYCLFVSHAFDPVPPMKCDRVNEVYSDNISPCGNLCENYGQRCTIVNKMAITGCDCVKGYARLGEQGRCVQIDSAQCVLRYPASKENCALRPNEEYVEGTYDCQTLCETTLTGPCQLLSLLPINDCFCKRGYARIEGGGPCVPICSRKCLQKVRYPRSCAE
ncbi:inducible metalloproteinase inhibitor protein-like [Bradysia coprophila]|uniref:inducible metalloproteinase inhibitor protein-like n=1 Tax=Bradysia coprophila TaxID=38358 RepID=UPI00187DB290|nr:inducible metalloproteinase inhibitor protein-like [Bradysia coprophila]